MLKHLFRQRGNSRGTVSSPRLRKCGEELTMEGVFELTGYISGRSSRYSPSPRLFRYVLPERQNHHDCAYEWSRPYRKSRHELDRDQRSFPGLRLFLHMVLNMGSLAPNGGLFSQTRAKVLDPISSYLVVIFSFLISYALDKKHLRGPWPIVRAHLVHSLRIGSIWPTSAGK